MQLTKRFLAALLLAAALLGGLTSGGLLLLVQGGTTQSAPANPAPNQTPIKQPETVKVADSSSGAELVSGSKGNQWDSSYRCKPAFTAVQVPVGKTVQKDGGTYTLDEKRADYGDQTSVVFHVKLADGVNAPTLIVNTAAHNMHPDLYPQRLIQASLQGGGSGDWTFQTSAYTDNYEAAGITDVTVCTLTQK